MIDTDQSRTESARGQTLPDFAVGIAIFLVTVTFVFLFVPQLTLPYEEHDRPVVVQRAASDLGTHLLAGEAPSELDEQCTVAFFAQSGGSNCPFDTDDPVPAQLGIASTYSVNVTLRTAPSDDPGSALLCDVNGTIDGCGSGGTPLSVGPSVPDANRSVAIARQRVYHGDTDAVIEVGVW